MMGGLEMDTLRPSFKAEVRDVVGLALPIMATTWSYEATWFTSQLFAGHIGIDELAAAAIGITYFDLMWFFMVGLAGAFDTLGSLAHGAGDSQSMDVWTVAGLMASSVLCVPIMVLLSFGKAVARVMFQQPEAVCKLAGQFCTCLIPGVLPLVWGLLLMKHLQVQGITLQPACTSIATFLLNIPLNFFLIRRVGFVGVPIATVLVWTANFLLLLGLVAFKCHRRKQEASFMVQLPPSPCHLLSHHSSMSQDRRNSRSSFDYSSIVLRSSSVTTRHIDYSIVPASSLSTSTTTRPASTLRGGRGGCASNLNHAVKLLKLASQKKALKQFLAIGISGGVMCTLESGIFWATEAMAGGLGTVPVAAHSVIVSIHNLVFLPYAISTAASIRVGNLLGANRPYAARMAAGICVAMAVALMLAAGGAMLALRDRIGGLFTNDAAAAEMISSVIPFLAAFEPLDAINIVSQGVLQGLGRQLQLAAQNLAGYWGVGMSTAFIIAFKVGLGMKGIWIGLIAAVTFTGCVASVTVLLLDWEEESGKAQDVLLMGQMEEGDVVTQLVEVRSRLPLV